MLAVNAATPLHVLKDTGENRLKQQKWKEKGSCNVTKNEYSIAKCECCVKREIFDVWAFRCLLAISFSEFSRDSFFFLLINWRSIRRLFLQFFCVRNYFKLPTDLPALNIWSEITTLSAHLAFQLGWHLWTVVQLSLHSFLASYRYLRKSFREGSCCLASR